MMRSLYHSQIFNISPCNFHFFHCNKTTHFEMDVIHVHRFENVIASFSKRPHAVL